MFVCVYVCVVEGGAKAGEGPFLERGYNKYFENICMNKMAKMANLHKPLIVDYRKIVILRLSLPHKNVYVGFLINPSLPQKIH